MLTSRPLTIPNYSCHIKSISHHITPLVINSFRGGHTPNTQIHTRKHTCIETFVDRSNSKKPGASAAGSAPGLIIVGKVSFLVITYV